MAVDKKLTEILFNSNILLEDINSMKQAYLEKLSVISFMPIILVSLIIVSCFSVACGLG